VVVSTGEVAKRRSSLYLIASLSVLLILAAAFAIWMHVRASSEAGPDGNLRASRLTANVSTSLSNTMGLSPTPNEKAPGFTLVDQGGRTVSLASFRGKAVVLEFMDPHCTDICPLVSEEFVDAYHDLGRKAGSVVFAAVNVNPYHTSVNSVAAFSRGHSLDSIPDWHFLTGPVAVLRPIWSKYGVYVEAPNPNSDVIHTSLVYFIGPNGHLRYIADPTDDHTKQGVAFLPPIQLKAWGTGIATVARDLVKQTDR
jgi:cytochrome oxidase Cu insertion factor (SCO1/SenC/PrrC family)